MKVSHKLDELLKLWKQKADDERSIAKQYEHFEKDRMYKLGVAHGIEICMNDFVLASTPSASKKTRI